MRSLKPWHVALFLVALVAAFVAIWPLGLGHDYMNHLALAYIEGNVHSDPVLQQFYSASFDYVPHLTMDLIVPWLSQIIGIYAAGAVLVWFAFVMPPIAGVVLAHTLHGRITWMSLLGFLAVFNANMSFGFVDFNASIGLALLAFVLWIRMPPGWQRTIVFFPIGLVLTINHALAFLVFGYLALVWEIVQFFKGERARIGKFLLQLVCLDSLAMLGGLIFLGLSVTGSPDITPNSAMPNVPEVRVFAFVSGTLFGEFLFTAFLTPVILAAFYLGARNKWISFTPAMGWVCVAFLILVACLPVAILGIWGLHMRYTALLLILLAASVQISPGLSQVRRKALFAACFAMLSLTFVNGANEFRKIDHQADEFRVLLADLPQGSKILKSFSSEEAKTNFSLHAINMSVIERQAFVSALFTNTSLVDVTPAMVDFNLPQLNGLSPKALAIAVMRPAVASENGYWSLGFANDWPNRWDYIMLFKTPDDPGLQDLPVCEVSSIETAILYKVGSCP
jgi:hypothetical protein